MARWGVEGFLGCQCHHRVKPAGWTGLSLSSCGWPRRALGVLVAHQPSCNFSGAVPGFCSPQPLLEGLRPLLAPGQSSSIWTAGRTPPPRQRCLLIQNLGSLHRGRFESGPDTQWATTKGTYLRGLSWAREDEQISARPARISSAHRDRGSFIQSRLLSRRPQQHFALSTLHPLKGSGHADRTEGGT